MSGGTVPYHLRQNKAIERNIFIELLLKLNRYANISAYSYIGFGGPFLEDFKAVHAVTGIDKMISLEYDKKVRARQDFNMPLSCIDCKHTSSGEFIGQHNFADSTIIWLDYAEPKDLGDQFNEFEFLLTQLKERDVVKITLNANADELVSSECLESDEILNEKRLETLGTRIEKYLPFDVTEEMMYKERYPQVLCQSLLIAAQKGMEGKAGFLFQPLTAFVYADSRHSMLTLTGIILPVNTEELDRFFEVTGLKDWPLSIPAENVPRTIKVPELSVRERLFLDTQLPQEDYKAVQSKLGFLVDENEEDSLEGIRNYVQYYRQYPYFSKILV